MSAESVLAASQINSMIERVANLASSATLDVGGFTSQAYNALYGLGPIGAVNIQGGQPPQYPPAPEIPTLPPFETLLSGMPTLPSFEGAMTKFLAQFFPGSEDARALSQLLDIANRAFKAIDDLQKRTNDEKQARTYLGDQFGGGRIQYATDRMRESIVFGGDATYQLSTVQGAGFSATRYLLSRFEEGDAATTKLLEMIAGGGSSIPMDVENQTWQRDRGRVLAETRKQKQSTIDAWAARGYPLPTGGAAMAIYMIDSEGQDRIAQSSRERAIKETDVLIENIKFAANLALTDAGASARGLTQDASGASKALLDDARAATQLTIENAREAAKILLNDSMEACKSLVDAAIRAASPIVSLRVSAIGAAAEYVRSLAIEPQLQADIIKTQISAASAASQAITSYYVAQINANSAYLNAEVAIADLSIKPVLANASNATQLLVEQNRTVTSIAEAKSRVAMGAATQAGAIAASALTSLHASVNLSQNT